MKSLAVGSVDLAFADPPFNIGYEYDVYHDKLESERYLAWCRDWIGEVVRVLKADGTFWLAIGDEYAAELKVMMQRELGLVCRSWVIWYYTFGVNCTKKFSRSHAHLFHMVKDRRKFTFNSKAVRVPSARQLVYGDGRANPDGRLPDDTWVLRPQDIPQSFQPDEDTLYFPRINGTFKEREGWHGCQMPEQLLGRIIRACSNEGELVLDPFGGSGTTLAVAKKLGRKYLGFELSAEYAARIEKRLASIEPGDPLDGAPEPLVSAPSTAAGVRLEDRERRKVEAGQKATNRKSRRSTQGKDVLLWEQRDPPGGREDRRMTRLNLVLLFAVMLSAMYLVQVQYDSRRLYAEIERAHGEARRLEIEHERLQVEKRAQATPLRVERLAKDQLQMRPASPAITQYVATERRPQP
jgi:site-specific DNA-methyltransferase (adenine-specific)